MTWKTEPRVTSDALMGVPDGSRVRRVPFFHMVFLKQLDRVCGRAEVAEQ